MAFQYTNKLCSPNVSPRGSLCFTVKRGGFINTRYPSRSLSQKLEDVAGVERHWNALKCWQICSRFPFRTRVCRMRRDQVPSCGRGLLWPKARGWRWARRWCRRGTGSATRVLSSCHPMKGQPQRCHLQRERTGKMSVVEVSPEQGGRQRQGQRMDAVSAV